MNIDLLNYIEQARKSGMTDNQIRSGLLQSGWPASSVEEALMNAPMASAPLPKPKAMMSKMLAVIFIILGLAVAGYFAGAYYMTNYQSFPLWPFDVNVPVPTFTPRPSPIATPDPTADWQTYRNEEYGFEFKYPGEFYTYPEDSKPQGGPIDALFGKNIVVYLFINSNFGDFGGDEKTVENHKIIQGKETLEIELDGNKILSLQFDSNENKSILINQILSTFKFVDTDVAEYLNSVEYRDMRRYLDVYNWWVALELYKIDNGKYPDDFSVLIPTYGNHLRLESWKPVDGQCTEVDNKYTYTSLSDGKSFNLKFCLGHAFDWKKAGLNAGVNLSPGNHIADPSGIK